jgi:DNA-directed RNA polymerase subunit RPC12/RpoP
MATRGRQGQGAEGPIGARWDGQAQDLFGGLREWRATHPKATFAEIEAELDRQLQHVRGLMLEDLALASTAADLQAQAATVCPDCGGALRDEGVHPRTLVTWGNVPVTLRRDYATCPACGSRVFPPGR